MQDVRAGGRFFGGGDRRVRQHNHQAAALKCPRCDSFNTKFCYYNNYNLSQPRYFCKGCRRYWTKGGVLRNVPVGGGCRKTKRSKQKSGERDAHARSSSSESSSLTKPTVRERGSDLKNKPSSSVAVCDFSDSRFVNANPKFDYPVYNPTTDSQIFANLTSEFGITNIPTTSYRWVQKESRDPGPKDPSCAIMGSASGEEFKLQDMNSEGLTTTTTAEVVELDWGGGRGGGGGGGGDDEELFNLTAAVDPAYWSQPQWTDGGDQSLNFLS